VRSGGEREGGSLKDRSANVWAIACYFNPAGYQRRIENYRLFRERLAVPLVTVELAFDGRFELGRGDADVLVQISGGSILWQKERLLNLALREVPGGCERVAWLDTDVIFENDEWVERASRALDEFALIHLFRDRHDLTPHEGRGRLPRADAPPTSQSVVCKIGAGETIRGDLFVAKALLEQQCTLGLAWASRRDILETHGLYDACILGGGDRAIVCAALGEFAHGEHACLMGPRRAAHYRAWARLYFAAVRRRVSHIEGRLFHLWHGDLNDRRYDARHRALEDHGFDPFTDVALDHNGCWRWSSDKPKLHDVVKRYFESRNEDSERVGEETQRPGGMTRK
jgi:hypothetical protein